MTDQQKDLRPHFILTGTSKAEKYGRPPSGGGQDRRLPTVDRNSHGSLLLQQLNKIKSIADDAKRLQTDAGIEEGLGLRLQFSSFPDLELAFEKLDRKQQSIELLNVKHENNITTAAVFVPDGKLVHLERLVLDYLQENTKPSKNHPGGRPKNQDLIETIQELHVATFQAIWTDDDSVLPESNTEQIWWEVWLPVMENRQRVLSQFREIAEGIDFELSETELEFPERTVLLMRGSQQQIQHSILLLNSIAELRRAKETAEFFDSLTPVEQRGWVDDLLARTWFPEQHSPYICILDTGINRGHPLLQAALDANDQHANDPSWDPADEEGHGTEMAGLALYGDLSVPMNSTEPFKITHRLESVKILRRDGDNAGKHLGNITAEAVSRPEITAPFRARVFSMAVTSKDGRDRGRPSAWSAELDRLACDYEGDGLTPRLFVVSAGNARNDHAWLDYPVSNGTDSIHDPAQAWNVLTVGAFTEKDQITEPDTDDYEPIAPCGSLSPFSTTSRTWQKVWPLKPDVVLEGGNVAKDAISAVSMHSLSLLATHFEPNVRLLTTTNATSAATALCARIAAQIMAQYPNLWPETVRALIIHSAEWTPAMKAMFLDGKERSRDYEHLIRYCGFGVPDLGRAIWSASNSLTLIVQDELQPFEKVKNDPETRDMHLHELPWPLEMLESLGETSVEMRVTLSYFIEPSPGGRGGKGRYRYESHGLRFEVRRPTESTDEFRRRINRRARDEEEDSVSGGSDPGWRLGTQRRHHGSIHSDSWCGTASDLAQRGVLAVYPAMGWWKTRKALERYDKKARYALLVSIHTPEIDVDLYNTVEQIIQTSTAIEISS